MLTFSRLQPSQTGGDVQAEPMEKGETSSVLRRKAQSGRDVHQARAMSIAKALRLSVAKVADKMFDMAMSVIGVTREVAKGASIAGSFEGPGLLTLLDGPDRRTGAAVFDQALVGGLIQQQTMGCVLPVVEGAAPRAMTPTDASLCAPFLDVLLERAAPLPEDEADRAVMNGFRFGSRVEDARILQLALEAAEYDVIRLTLDIAGGKRQGVLTLVFPIGVDPLMELPDEIGNEASESAHKIGLRDVVLELETEISVALTRLRLPLARIGALNVGDTLDLGVNGLDNALVLSADGRVLSRGRLGLSAGTRAIQLIADKSRGQQPQRRASDRTELDQPHFSAMEPGDTIDMPADLDLRSDFADAPDLAEIPDLPDLDEMPDMSDLPELSDIPPLDVETG